MEQFEQIRRDRDREGLSIRELARRHGVHRRAVREALLSAVPPAKRSPVGRPAPKLGSNRAVIEGWLLADRDAPRKQRHTAKRIHQRLVDEHGADVAETTVRQYVRARKRELGLAVGEVFVPQVHAPGVEAEVDWGEALVVLAGVLRKVHLFVMRASFSGAAFCQASLVETQQAFLEAIPPGDQGEIAGGRLGPRGELNPAWVAVGDQQNVARFRFEETLHALIAIGAVAGVTAPVRSGEWKARLWERMGFPSVDREEIEAKIRDLALTRGGDSQQELVGVIAGSSELLDGWRVLYGLRFEDGIGFTCWQQQDGEPREDQPVAARGGVDSANV